MQHFAKEIVARLAQAQVEFVIVGGVSAVLQGVPILTLDLVICYRRTPDNLARLAAALAPLAPRPRGFPSDLPFVLDERALQLGCNFTLSVGDEDLDLLGEMSAIGGFDQIVGQAVQVKVGKTSALALSLPQLIVTKEAAGRTKDLAVLPILKASLELKKQQGDP